MAFLKILKDRQLPVVPYNDFYFRVLLSLVASHILVMYNEPDTFFQAVFTASYWIGMAGSFIISILLTGYIYTVTVRLDRKLDWQDRAVQRLLWQGLLGFLAPAIGAFLLAAIFFSIMGLHILQTSYLRQDYTIILLMLLVMNLYYFGLNSYLLRRKPKEGASDKPPAQAPQPREILIVDTPARSIPVQLKEVAYFFILKGSVFMRTDNMPSLNDSYPLDMPLKQLEGLLDKNMFFRINRQMIVNFRACGAYRPGRNKTLELTVDPPPYPRDVKVPKEHERLCIISEDRVRQFRIWMDR